MGLYARKSTKARESIKQGTVPHYFTIFSRLKDALVQEFKGLQEDPVDALHSTKYHPSEQDLGEHIYRFVKHFKRSQLNNKYGCNLFVRSLAADSALQLAIEQ